MLYSLIPNWNEIFNRLQIQMCECIVYRFDEKYPKSFSVLFHTFSQQKMSLTNFRNELQMLIFECMS